MDKVEAVSKDKLYCCKKIDSNKTDSRFKDAMENACCENIIKELTQKFNISVLVKSASDGSNLATGESDLDGYGAFEIGTPVIIAPNILKEMSENPKKKEYVENTIKDFFAQQPALNASLAMQGKRQTFSVIVFHADGTWTESGECEPTPEKLSEIKKEQEAKKDNNEEQIEQLEEFEQIGQYETYYKNLEESKIRQAAYNKNNLSTNQNFNFNPDMIDIMSKISTLLNSSDYL